MSWAFVPPLAELPPSRPGMVHAVCFRPDGSQRQRLRIFSECARRIRLALADRHRAAWRTFAQPLERNFKGTRIAMFKDMGLPWEPAVRDAVRAQSKVFESLGCVVEEAEPDLHDADECFRRVATLGRGADGRDLVAKHPDLVNDYVNWHVTEGGKLTGSYSSRYRSKTHAVYQTMRKFMDRYEFFVCR